MNLRRKWTSTEIRTLASRYPVEGPVLLMEELGRSKNSITSQARRLWVKADSRWRRASIKRVTHNTTVNSRFFDEPSPESAYVVGFGFGCGTIKSKHRWVLKLRVENHRTTALQRVLDLMESKHQIQQPGSWNVVEICNSRLVQSLILNWEYPSGRSKVDPAFPDLMTDLIVNFARGHLSATGFNEESVIRWSGTHRLMGRMQNELKRRVGVSTPLVNQHGHKISIAWTDPIEVERIQNWLNPG